ncbi:ribonuclease H-like domain-containing protein, partial [Tanacetum coccineum]
MAGEDDQNINNQPYNPPLPTQQSPHTVSTIKLLILKKGEYDIWVMKMEHYLAHTDYPILPPKSTEEILARERERKARTTLLMALLEDYLARFHNIFDAKEMWDSIKTIFGGNAKNTGYKGRDQRTGKQEQPKALLTIDVGVIDWSGQAEEEEEDHALMAFNSNRVPVSNEMIKLIVLTYHKKLLAEAEKEKEDLKAKVEKWHNSSKNLNILLNSQMSARDKVGLGGDASVPPPMTGIYIPSGPDKEIDDSQFTYGPKQSKPSESDARSSDFTSCESNTSKETHESMPETVVNEPTVVSQPKVWNDAPIIEEYESDSEDEHVSLPSKEQETPSFANTIKHIKTPRQTVKQQNTCSKSPKPDKKDCSGLISKKLGLGYGFTTKACFVCGSLSHLIRDCDFHEKRMAKQVELNKQKGKGNVQRENKPIWNNVQRVNHKNQFVPTTVLTRTGKILVKTARASASLNGDEKDQTVLGKDYSNMLIADSLLKTIWFINAPCYGNEALASPKANSCDAEEMRCKFKIKSENSAYTISIITAIVTSRYPITNNQLRNSSNPRQQATINNERVTLQPIQGRQTSVAGGTSRTYTPGASGNNSGKQRTFICYNCKGEGHMSKQCTKPKRKRDDSWFKALQGLILRVQVETILENKERLFATTAKGKATCPNSATNQRGNGMIHADDLDAYESDCDELNTAKVMNLNCQISSHGEIYLTRTDALSEETEITNDSNIIPYSQYLIESQQVAVQSSNSSAQQDDLILSVIKQLKTQVVHCTKTNLENKSVNDTLTDGLERYKEQVKVLKEGQNVALKSQDNVSDSCAQSVEIDHLKRTISEHLKEKESLLQTVTLLKNNFKKEEYRNLDREIALEKQIKHLDNIV